MTTTEDDAREVAYIEGQRSVWRRLLTDALRELGYDSPEATNAKWIAEREEAIAKLREVCGEHGDNNWTPSLYLADIIDKHLARHLD